VSRLLEIGIMRKEENRKKDANVFLIFDKMIIRKQRLCRNIFDKIDDCD
jgi:hypothetical protein